METITRALELARSGRFQNMKDLRAALQAERMAQIDEHLAGASFKKQLKALMDAAGKAHA
jgi:hypothetical protein